MLSIATGGDHRYLTREIAQGAEHHYIHTIALGSEPPGTWWGAGAEKLGLTGTADTETLDTVYGDLEHPVTGAPLGNRPATTRPLHERLAAAHAELPPDATAEERAAAEHTVRATHRRAVKYFDLTFSAPKSWSILHAAYQIKALQARENGDLEQATEWQAAADAVWDAWMEGVHASLDLLQDKAGYSRAGRNGVRRLDAHEWTVALFRQHTSRNQDPQLHVHCGLLNRVWTTERDPATGTTVGKWRTLDGRFLYTHRAEAGAISERVAEEALLRRVGARVALRPDGKAREILGIDQALRDTHSSRRKLIATEVAAMASAYEREHGRPPTPYRLACMAQEASLRTRNPKKKHAEPREDLLKRWNTRSATTPQTITTVPGRVREAASNAGRSAEPFNPDTVITRTLEKVQATKATFTRADIVVELNRQLPDCLGGLTAQQVRALLDELTEDALTPWRSQQRPGRPAVAQLTPPHLAAVPDELKLADGTSKYVRPHREIYTTDERLVAETDITEAATQHGAHAVPAETVEDVIRRSTLGTAQASAVRAIATSGRFIDILVGPAGTGKSHTVARLCQTWEADGGTVLGLAVGQRQANVLAQEGVSHAENVRMLLHTNQRITAGHPVQDAERYRLRPGQLVVVDEAATCNTDDLHAIITLAREAGAKILLTGDFAQTTAIGAGGMFHHLATTSSHTHTLDQVHRFHEPWQRDASLLLRSGDHTALAEYEARNRLHSGTTHRMQQDLGTAWTTDHLAGLNTVVITATNDEASRIAGNLRHELVRHRLVEADGVRLHDGNLAGIGDRLQLRRNNRDITTHDGERWAANRDTVTVRSRTDDGTLTVAYPDGATMDLPATYVRQHTELAYAVTVHAAQATTVDTAHTLVDPRMSREQLYVALSRGRRENHAYTPTDTPQTPQAGNQPHEAILTKILRRSEAEPTAVRVLQDEMDHADALDALAPIWTDLVEEHWARAHGQALHDTLGAPAYRSIAAEHAYRALLTLARHAEERGINADPLLRTAATLGPLEDARSVSAVLHWRLKGEIALAEQDRTRLREARIKAEAAPGQWGTEAEIRLRHAAYFKEQERKSSTYTARTPNIPGPRGEYARRLAELLDNRVTSLGERAATTPTPWLTARLGPVPAEPHQRAAWAEAAGKAMAYREQAGYTSETDAIGPKPTESNVDKHTSWIQAAAALGIAEADRPLEAASDAELREVADRARRELTWAPPYVKPHLKQAHQAHAEARTREIGISMQIPHTIGPDRRAALRRQLNTAQQQRFEAETRIRRLERVNAIRTQWAAHTQDTREQARTAQDILARRDPDQTARTAPTPINQESTRTSPGNDAAQPNLRQARRQAARAERILNEPSLPDPQPRLAPGDAAVQHGVPHSTKSTRSSRVELGLRLKR